MNDHGYIYASISDFFVSPIGLIINVYDLAKFKLRIFKLFGYIYLFLMLQQAY